MKKGYIFVTFVNLIIFLILLSAFITLISKYAVKDKQGTDRIIGDHQALLFMTYQRGENALSYVFQAAKFALPRAITGLATSKAGCGEYLGSSIWSNRTKSMEDCFPKTRADLETKFNNALNENLNKFLIVYTDTPIPQNNYLLTLKQDKTLTVLGLANLPITIPFGSFQTLPDQVQKPSSLAWPADGLISSCYGYRQLALEGIQRSADWHDGLDIAVVVGTNVVSVADGTVEQTCNEWVGACACSVGIAAGSPGGCAEPKLCRGKCGNYGNYITVKYSDTFYTKYAHLSEILVKPGQRVKKGELIAKSGNTGLSGGPHLHFGVYLSNDFSADVGKGSYDRNPLCFLPAIPDTKFLPGICNDPNSKSCGTSSPQSSILTAQEENSYSIKPNFKVQLNYSLGEYDLLSKSLAAVSESIKHQCKLGDMNYDTCVTKALEANKDFRWSLSCGTDEEKLLYGLLETMTLCSKNSVNGYCFYDIPQTKDNIKITFKRNDALKLTSVTSQKINEVLQQPYPYLVDTISNDKATLGTCEVVTLNIQGGIAAVSGENCVSSKKISWSYNQKITLYNQVSPAGKTSSIAFIDPAAGKATPTLPIVKREVRVCTESKYSFLNESGKMEHFTYKIAFFVGDSIPPKPVQDVKVTDTPHAEANVTVSFKANEETDIDHYSIYYSTESFTSIANAKLLKTVRSSDVQSYSTTTNLSDDGTFNFAVTATDTSGNENPQVTTVQGTSIDDLKPGPVQKLEFTKNPGLAPIITLAITPPISNEDGSLLKDLKEYILYLKDTSADACSASDIPSVILAGKRYTPATDMTSVPHKAQFELPDKTKKYCLVVIANDETAEGVIQTDQYSANSILFVKT